MLDEESSPITQSKQGTIGGAGTNELGDDYKFHDSNSST